MARKGKGRYKNPFSPSSSSLTPLSPPVRIFMEGLVSGLFAAFTIKTGINPDPVAQMGNVLDIIIDTVEKLDPGFNGSKFRSFFGLTAFIVGIVGLFEVFNLAENWLFGIMLFIVGFLFGFIITLFSNLF
ncbi:hypothetical protein L0665_00875 [Methanogenium marinum]|uniref:Uncharacterized protein n=1 Tax=Methanogenium marinum TaxID=348610 RepID=A0A9Q4PWB4_9EURY|nr:hypothetical protein [Methanogenium marinum]MDE4907181.1 hypothetical protein [Methanogenium marinum]